MIEFKNSTIKNKNQTSVVLENINLTIGDNSFVAIIGKSGIGKTTLLNSLVMNCDVSLNSIFVDNVNISSLKRKQLNNFRKTVGWITQKNFLIEDLSVFDNLKIIYNGYKNNFYKIFNILRKQDKENIFNALNKLGILDKCYQKVSQLSGGQQKRVQVARLLLNKYKYIFADEPTSNLDIKTSKEILELLKFITLENNATTLITIHDLEQIYTCFDHIIALKNKSILFDSFRKKITRNKLEEVYE